MSSMISPIAPRIHYNQAMTSSSVSGSTPSGDLQNLRLASCVSLYNPLQPNLVQHDLQSSTSISTANLAAPSDSPRSSRGIDGGGIIDVDWWCLILDKMPRELLGLSLGAAKFAVDIEVLDCKSCCTKLG
jgi:hypothetical protein